MPFLTHNNSYSVKLMCFWYHYIKVFMEEFLRTAVLPIYGLFH